MQLTAIVCTSKALLTELIDMTKDPFMKIIYIYGTDGFATVSIPVGKESDYFMTERRKRRYHAPVSEMPTKLRQSRFLSHGQDICWGNVPQTREKVLLLLLGAKHDIKW